MTRFAPLGLHRCRLIMAAVVGSWLMADVRPALAQSDASPLPSFDFRQAGAVAGWGAAARREPYRGDKAGHGGAH